MPGVTVNGAELYYEVRGSGPPVLLIMGGTGDGGHFDTLADRLADEFTVVTYDRRGNGRSPIRPDGQRPRPRSRRMTQPASWMYWGSVRRPSSARAAAGTSLCGC
jgi:pimeloyl-ACP methyl ester carboxylesterase